MQQTQKYWNTVSLIASGVLVFLLVAGIALAFTPKVKNWKQYRAIHTENKIEIECLTNEEVQIKENIRRIANDSDFIEHIAHEKGYAREDETIFYFSDDVEN